MMKINKRSVTWSFLLIISGIVLASCLDAGKPEISNEFEVQAVAFVAHEPPQAVNERLNSLNKFEVLSYLRDLWLEDSEVLAPSSNQKTMIFAIFGDLKVGEEIEIEWQVDRPTLERPYKEIEKFRVQRGSMISPYIITYFLYNENPGVFDYTVRYKGKEIGSVQKIYKDGINE